MVRNTRTALRRFTGAFALSTFAVGALISVPAQAWLGPDQACAKAETQDTQMALFEPDKYAWVLFKELNHPANMWAQCPSSSKALGDEGPVLWESWRNVMPGARRTTFRQDAAWPGSWRAIAPTKEQIDRISGNNDGPLMKTEGSTEAVRNVPNNPNRKRAKGSKFGSKIIGGQEVRINRETYLHIRDNELYNRDVLAKLAVQGGSASLDLPPGTKEIKARWSQITEEDKPRYHWTRFRDQHGNEQLWGLTGLHITTKDLPNWFWTTFEHVDNAPGFVNKSVDAYSCPDQPEGCNASPPELKGTKWENYRLRGTQTNFVDVRGRTVVLANSQIENGIEDRSSCMTCHAESALEEHGKHIQLSSAFTGKPRENKLGDLMLMDFMFIFKKASSPPKEKKRKAKVEAVTEAKAG